MVKYRNKATTTWKLPFWHLQAFRKPQIQNKREKKRHKKALAKKQHPLGTNGSKELKTHAQQSTCCE